jgi:prepilin-type N-terminal cleavage/methylation domain-containing protein
MATDAITQGRIKKQRAFTLIETMIAIAVLTVGLIGVLGLFASTTALNSRQGDYGTRTTEYAQDKIEQLMGLQFTDTTSNTTVTPTAATGGNGLTSGGSVNPASPVTGYQDFINSTGNQQSAAPTGFYYKRQWQVIANADGTLTILAYVQLVGGPTGAGALPSTTLGSIKANF